MGTRKDGSKTITMEATFSLVVKVNKGIDPITMLKEETEFISEPTSPNGFVMAMNLKNVKEVSNGTPKESG